MERQRVSSPCREARAYARGPRARAYVCGCGRQRRASAVICVSGHIEYQQTRSCTPRQQTYCTCTPRKQASSRTMGGRGRTPSVRRLPALWCWEDIVVVCGGGRREHFKLPSPSKAGGASCVRAPRRPVERDAGRPPASAAALRRSAGCAAGARRAARVGGRDVRRGGQLQQGRGEG